MTDPTITLSPAGTHFILLMPPRPGPSKDGSISQHVSIPINEAGMDALRQLLQARQTAHKAGTDKRIGHDCNPTQYIVDQWLKNHSPTTTDSMRREQAAQRLKEMGLEDIGELKELGL